MEGFRIYLKTFLGLAMPNQYPQNCQKVSVKLDNLGPKSLNLDDPINKQV